ncbi:hypothetical protein GS8_421 [Geobacillus stearothermophilus]|uniref:Uncharacterized protein n=1 Tax=Geobacillus stearothermophilus TaxID=1422 RepID=A0ABQ7HIT6_GEOSE|nr:hypothetical protein GS8_421 [Geobacillus stearothermophilus]
MDTPEGPKSLDTSTFLEGWICYNKKGDRGALYDLFFFINDATDVMAWFTA